jgi:hypothetical protein
MLLIDYRIASNQCKLLPAGKVKVENIHFMRIRIIAPG